MRDWKPEVRARLESAKLTPERTAEIEEELTQHLCDRYEDLLFRGFSEAEADAAVIAELNTSALVKELCREEPRYAMPIVLGQDGPSRGFLLSVLQDIRYGIRVLCLSPGFTAVCILSLALGIGANGAIFELIDAVRLRALPVPDPGSLSIVRIANRKFVSGRSSGNYPDLSFAMWKEIEGHQQAFSSIAAWSPTAFNLANGGQVHYARGMFVSGEFFTVLRQTPELGRLLLPSDDTATCESTSAVVSYAFWQHEFGGTSNIIGRKLTLDGHPFEIIGITRARFYGVEVGRNYDVAVPLCTEPIFHGENSLTSLRHGWWLASIGRLKPGWTLEKATAHLQSISPAILEATVPTVYSPESVKKFMEYKLGAFPGGNGFSRLRKKYESPLWILLAVAGVVLLIACANLANLMLARAGSREREIAVRIALGAGRTRLIRQLLTESLLLAIAGSLAGASLASGLSAYLVRYLSGTNTPIYLERTLDWRILGFTAGLACLACVLFGLAPALKASRTAPVTIMNAAGRAVTATRERLNARQALVIGQIALSLMLVVGALLFVRTLRNLLNVDAGFQRDDVVVIDADFTSLKIPPAEHSRFRETLLEQVRSVPGITSAAETFIVPLSGNGWNNNVIVDGKRNDANVNMDRVSAGYFGTMRIPVIEGRDFNSDDTAHSPKVAIVNQEFARKVLGTENVVGRRFKIDVYKGDPQYEFQIVGLVKSTKYYDLREDLEPMAYYPLMQEEEPDASTEIVVRTNLPLSSLAPSVQKAIGRINQGVSVDFTEMDTMVKEGLLRERLLATLATFFGILAGLLATVGLYGVVAYMVVQRTNEIGIRMALGARPQQILYLILGEASRLFGIGVAIGIVLSLLTARSAKTLLYGLAPYDPSTVTAAAFGLAVIAVAATLIPANRAARLNPMSALREQ